MNFTAEINFPKPIEWTTDSNFNNKRHIFYTISFICLFILGLINIFVSQTDLYATLPIERRSFRL